MSNDALDYTNVVTEFYTARNPLSYYTDPSKSYGSMASELAREALDYLARTGFNFAQLSRDANGRVRALNLMYAGARSNAWAEGLWPHKSNSFSYTAGGTSFLYYQITDMPNSLTVGTFIHENGHLLFNWADTYDTTYVSRGVGRYDLMSSSGSTNPVPPNPFYRNVLAGWGEPQIINNFTPNSTISIPANQVSAHIYRRNNDREFFVIENIQATGRWTGISAPGLYIWHADDDKRSVSNTQSDMTPARHFHVSVEQADGLFHLERNVNSGDTTDSFRAGFTGSKTEFTDFTVPNTKWWDGNSSGLAITNISAAGNTMTYKVGNPALTTDLKLTIEFVGNQSLYVLPGDVVTYKLKLENTGNTTISEPNMILTSSLHPGWT